MGFFDTIARGWAISKLSFGVVWRDPELLVYMLISSIMGPRLPASPEALSPRALPG